MNVILLLFVLLVISNGLGMAVSGLAAHFLWVQTVDGLGMCDIFLAGSVLGCCGGCDGLVMGLCLDK